MKHQKLPTEIWFMPLLFNPSEHAASLRSHFVVSNTRCVKDERGGVGMWTQSKCSVEPHRRCMKFAFYSNIYKLLT